MLVTLTLDLRVWDAAEFRAAAVARALADGLGVEEANSFLARPLSDCAVMLIDPGTGPAGSDILGSSAEQHASRDTLRSWSHG
ncbi:MAG: hypothetical protein ABS82_15285 [Rhodanobacter sp. SCN 67-45]|nr:MAG: hypothetical protein ABS82_15285 [Rhodanobacter sp. SCN 67-45]